MAKSVWQAYIVDSDGAVVSEPTIEVRKESDGSLATIYTDDTGATTKSNPFTGDTDGLARFYATGTSYKITVTKGVFSSVFRHVRLGEAAGFDVGSDPGQLITRATADSLYMVGGNISTNKLLGRSSAGTGPVEEITCTAAGRALLDDANAAAQRATLGLGSLATLSAFPGFVLLLDSSNYVSASVTATDTPTIIYFSPNSVEGSAPALTYGAVYSVSGDRGKVVLYPGEYIMETRFRLGRTGSTGYIAGVIAKMVGGIYVDAYQTNLLDVSDDSYQYIKTEPITVTAITEFKFYLIKDSSGTAAAGEQFKTQMFDTTLASIPDVPASQVRVWRKQ